jgi:hypothetical protein
LRRGQVRHDRGAGIFQCSRSAGCADCSAYAVQTSSWTRGVCVRVRVFFFFSLSFFLSFFLTVFLALFLSVHIIFFVVLFFSSPFAGSEGGERGGGHVIIWSFLVSACFLCLMIRSASSLPFSSLQMALLVNYTLHLQQYPMPDFHSFLFASTHPQSQTELT